MHDGQRKPESQEDKNVREQFKVIFQMSRKEGRESMKHRKEM